MSSRHVPVLLDEVLRWLRPAAGSVLVDLTLGGAGYSSALLERGARVIAFDRDPRAIAGARQRLASHGAAFTARQAPFADFAQVLDELRIEKVDGICMDLGLSSDQLDDSERGFGFRHEGELDLRFDPGHGESAQQLLRRIDVVALQSLLEKFGEVHRARSIARALKQLSGNIDVGSVREAVRAQLPGSERPEPELARVFQALRIAVNDELGQLDAALEAIPDRLNAGGRFVAVSYHSLEDRRVKQMLRRESGMDRPRGRHIPQLETETPPRMRLLTRRAIAASEAELSRNPRARSAKLRAGERLP